MGQTFDKVPLEDLAGRVLPERGYAVNRLPNDHHRDHVTGRVRMSSTTSSRRIP